METSIYQVEMQYVTKDNPRTKTTETILLEQTDNTAAVNAVIEGLYSEEKYVCAVLLSRKVSKKRAIELSEDARCWCSL